MPDPTMRRPIRALTVRNPWPWCMTHSDKDCENRHWSPREIGPGDYLAIHAGMGLDEYVIPMLREEFGLIVPVEQLVFGAIVMVATLDGVESVARQINGRPDRWFAGGGQVGWYLRDKIVLPEPVKCKGKQGLWMPDDDVLTVVRRQYGEVRRAA